MKATQAALLLTMSVATSLCLFIVHQKWMVTPSMPLLATLDIGELYRLKESQIASVLLKAEGTEKDRAAMLERAASFGRELDALLKALPSECRCLILARGALIASQPPLPDLTSEARQRLGL
jgi:hypothetical protein